MPTLEGLASVVALLFIFAVIGMLTCAYFATWIIIVAIQHLRVV